MTRSEALAIIEAALPALDDARVEKLAEMARALAEPQPVLRKLTAEELALIEQSKEDFRLGRTLTMEEARAGTDAFLKQLEAKYG